MREAIEDLISTFNARAQTDAQLREEIGGIERTIQLVTDKGAYHMTLRDGEIGGLTKGPLDGADVTIRCKEATFYGLIEGRIPPFKAMALGKLKLKASLEDALRLRKFFTARR